MNAPGKLLFSIIVPSYNAAASISRCLESVCTQNFTDFEVWVIDGLSSDATVQLVQNYREKDKRIKFIAEKDNGIYDACNKGIGQANGEWLLFLGADDKLYNNEVLATAAKKLQASAAGMVYGNVKIEGDLPWAKNGAVYDGEFTVEKLFYKNICHQAIFYRRTIFDKIGHYEVAYKISADWDFNHRCFAHCSVEYIDVIVSFFFAGGFSTANNNDAFTSRDIVLKLRKYHNLGYFNKLYQPYFWVFFNLSCHCITCKKYLRSVYFLFFTMLYAKKKTGLLKNYIAFFLRRNQLNQSKIQ